MTEFTDTARPEQILDTAEVEVAATPRPALKFYDPERNKKWGVATLEDIQAEFVGKQEALAARIRQDKAGRHNRTWNDLVERVCEGIRMKVLKQSLEGTKRSTETMARMTNYSAPTTQLRIQLADFLPWAAPQLRGLWARSQTENEPGMGVCDFEMPSDRFIIEMGQAAAKAAGCWGVPQVVLIAPAQTTMQIVDLPRAIGWKEKRKPPYPFWEDQGPLALPCEDYHLYMEIREPGRGQDPQPAWSLDLFALNGEPPVLHERGFVAFRKGDAFANARDALGRLKPHVRFNVTQAEDAATEMGELPGGLAVAKDATGKRHSTLTEIAVGLGMASGALAECLRNRGYLNLQGEATPAALDAGITAIVDGGAQFCFDAIKRLLDKPKGEGIEADETGEGEAPTSEIDPADQTVDVAAPDQPGEGEAPTPEIDPADQTADVAAPDQPGEGEAPTPEIDPVDETVDVAAVTETEEATNAMDRAPRVTVWRGGGMQRVTAQPKHQPIADAGKADKPRTEPLGTETSTRSIDAAALGTQAVKQLEGAIAALLSTEAAVGRRTDDGEFMAHAGDNQTLQNRIKTTALAMATARAALINSLPVCKTLTMEAQRLEVENAALKRRVQEQQATIDRLERGPTGSAEVFQFKASSNAEDGAATAASH